MTRSATCCSASTARRGSRRRHLDEHLSMLEEAEKRDHRKLGAELDLFSLPRGDRQRPARLPSEGRARPQADGGLLRGASRRGGLLASSTRRTSPRATCSRFPATWAGSRTACSRPWRWRAHDVLRQADELPDAHPDLPVARRGPTGSCRCGCSSSALSTATRSPASCTASPVCAA